MMLYRATKDDRTAYTKAKDEEAAYAQFMDHFRCSSIIDLESFEEVPDVEHGKVVEIYDEEC